MVNIEIGGVPEELRDMLAAEARARGQSFNDYLLELFKEAARREQAFGDLKRRDSTDE